MNSDQRCCGSNACIINADGECWCGQRWDGEKMCHPNSPKPLDEKSKIESTEKLNDSK